VNGLSIGEYQMNELLYSTRSKDQDAVMFAKDKMKDLGVLFTQDLSWNNHVNTVLNKSTNIIGRIHFLASRPKVDELVRLVTTQYFPVIFNDYPLWIGFLDSKTWRRIMNGHFIEH
jgi:hypothetical protein